VLSGQAGHTKKNDAGGSRRVTRKEKEKTPPLFNAATLL